MKHLRFFPTLKEYREFVYSKVVQNKEFHRHSFYRGLIEFIIDHRSPIFFDQSHDAERSHFTQYFNFVLIRPEYSNSYIRDLYFLHDFVHMVFENPLKPRRYVLDYYAQICNYNEYAAANETEVYIYYRLPALRKKTFKIPILYDIISKQYRKAPAIRTLFLLRKAIIEDNFVDGFVFRDSKKSKEIVKFIKKFNQNNKYWCEVWHKEFPHLDVDYSMSRLSLPVMEYDHFLEHYRPLNSEERYQKNVIANTRIALEMTGREMLPESFEECREALESLEDQIIMEKPAYLFHAKYTQSRKGYA